MIVIGIDPSLSTSGVARIDLGFGESGQTEAVRWETWRATTPKPEEVTVRSTARRIRLQVRDILAHIPDDIDLAVIEGPAMRARHAGLADERAGLRWSLVLQLCARGHVVIVSPKTRALFATNDGDAGKPAVLAAMRAKHPDLRIADDNIADGLALAEIGAYHLGLPMELTEKQKKSLAKVAWA